MHEIHDGNHRQHDRCDGKGRLTAHPLHEQQGEGDDNSAVESKHDTVEDQLADFCHKYDGQYRKCDIAEKENTPSDELNSVGIDNKCRSVGS